MTARDYLTIAFCGDLFKTTDFAENLSYYATNLITSCLLHISVELGIC